jgi:uncharacterized protein YndB with AHSA1/START domain
MNFSLTSSIARPRPQVFTLLADPEELKHWLPGFAGYEPLTGTPGTAGATARVTFGSADRATSLIETVMARNPPDLLASTYEHDTIIYSLLHRLEAVSPTETRWTCEFSSDVQRGGWLVNWLMSRALRAAGTKAMAEFKARAERPS